MVGFRHIVETRYVTLVLSPTNEIHDFPEGYLKHFPRFNGENGLPVQDDLDAFLYFVDNMKIKHENVYMRLFVQSLEGNV